MRRMGLSSSLPNQYPYPQDSESLPSKSAIRSQDKNIFDSLRHDTAQWISHWPAESFTRCSPLISACLIGPALSYAGERAKSSDFENDVDRETIILAIKRLARHWMICKLLLGKSLQRISLLQLSRLLMIFLNLDLLDQTERGQFCSTAGMTVTQQALRRHWRSFLVW